MVADYNHIAGAGDVEPEVAVEASRRRGTISDEQISDLVSKLQALLPEARLRSSDRVPSARVLQETCSYIRNLHREVDDLSEHLSELLATSAQAAVIRSLLM